MAKDISDLPDGYYFITSKKDPQMVLIYLYDNEDFNGVRHIAFEHPAGAALMPVCDLSDSSILIPAKITIGEVASTIKDLDRLSL